MLLLIFAAVAGVIMVVLRDHDVLATLAAVGVLASGVGSILALRAHHSSSGGWGERARSGRSLAAKCALTLLRRLGLLPDEWVIPVDLAGRRGGRMGKDG
jgi:hypothetical protein